MSKSGMAELEGGRRFGELPSKKTICSRNRVLSATCTGSCAWVRVPREFDGVWYRCSPLQLPARTHRNRSDGFVESQQKSPFGMGGMSLGAFGTIAKYRYVWATSVRIRTAALVKADRFRTPNFLSVYFIQIG